MKIIKINLHHEKPFIFITKLKIKYQLFTIIIIYKLIKTINKFPVYFRSWLKFKYVTSF